MIAEQCKALREQLEEVKRADDREKVVKQLNSRQEELVTLRDSVVRVTDSLNAIQSRTAIIGDLDSSKSLERVRKIRDALNVDPLSITKGHDFTNMKKAFEKFVEEGKDALEATWQAYLPKARPTLDKNQLAQAEQQKDFKTTTVQLKAREKHAAKLCKTPPSDEEEFTEIEKAWEDVRQMIAELPEVANDPTVQEFLKAANSSTGASIELLTDEVRVWLRNNNVADKYRITTM